jgi:hypothetical protein
MSDMRKLTLPLLIPLLCLFNTAFQTKSSLKFTVPPGWVEEERSSAMRVAQYKLPRAEGDTENGSVVLYYFGPGQGGSTTANIERWVGQIKQTDGGSSKAVAKEDHFEVNGLKVATVDVVGTYVAERTPGSGTFENKPGYRLLAAVVETSNGPYFLKLVGPEKTVAHWNESFQSFLKSFDFK